MKKPIRSVVPQKRSSKLKRRRSRPKSEKRRAAAARGAEARNDWPNIAGGSLDDVPF